MRAHTAALAAASLVAGVALGATATADAHQRSRYTKPCATDGEDTGPCFWDAGRRGNGRGYSYWIRADGCTVYLDGRRAIRCD